MWDRLVIIGLATLIALNTARWGWKLGKGGDWLAGAGGFVLAVIAVGIPFILVILGPATGR